MKRLIYILFALSCTVSVKAQEYGRNLGSVSVTYNGQSGKTFKYSDDQVELSVPKESMSEITVTARNISKAPIYFSWSESYLIINEETIPLNNNTNESAVAFGQAVKEANSVSSNTKIAPSSKSELRIGIKRGIFWDYQDANKYYKEHGKPREDKLVLVFEQDGKKIEKDIPIQVYTGKIIKQLKK